MGWITAHAIYDKDTDSYRITGEGTPTWIFPSSDGTVMLAGSGVTPSFTGTGTVTFEAGGGTYSALKITAGPVDAVQVRALIAERSTAGNAILARGPSHASSASAGAIIEGAIGITNNADYNNAASGGTKKNRIYLGSGGYDFDLVLQVPHQIRLVAADNDVTGGDADTAVDNGVGQIVMISRSSMILSPWALPEGLGDNYLIITAETETVATAGTGTYNGGNMVVTVNAGSLLLRPSTADNEYIDLMAYDVDGSAYASAIRIQNANDIEIGFFGATPVAKVVDGDFGNTPNSGDGDTDDLIDKIRDALIAYGLVAAS